MMRFNIIDLVSKKILATVDGKGAADREFVKLQNEHPKRRLDLRMSGGKEKIK